MTEFDSAGAVARSQPKSLAAFLAAGAEPSRLWRPEELAAVFRHQMAAPALVDLGGFDPAMATRLQGLTEAQGLLLKSFGDLLRHPVPPVELLELTKEFAKSNMDHPESTIPSEIAAVLYYASIGAALARLDRRISRLADADLRHGLLWARERAWIDEPTRQLLAEALEKLPAAA